MILLQAKSIMRGAAVAAKEVSKDPDKQDFIAYIVPIIIGACIISLLIAGVAKFVFEMDKDDAGGVFACVAIGITIIGIICYFV